MDIPSRRNKSPANIALQVIETRKLSHHAKVVVQSYLHTVNPETYTPNAHYACHTHNTNHLFNCGQVPTHHNTTSLWKKSLKAAEIIQEWESRLASLKD